jgi:hypothetical protein
MKSFHGVLAGNVHECSLKLSIGKVSVVAMLLSRCTKTVRSVHNAWRLPLAQKNLSENFEKTMSGWP